jgi:ABC-type cobalamin/Fe3+-siderophores transport system ATPase subunit
MENYEKEKKTSNVIITVAGTTSSGKSTLIYLLNEFLIENGWEVELNREVLKDYGSKDKFLTSVGRNLDEKINALQEKIKIVFSENQLNKEIKHQVNYKDKSYLDKRKILRQLSVKDEIENFINIVADDIWDKIKALLEDPKYLILKNVIGIEDVNFYYTIKTFLIDGYLAYEIIRKGNKIIDLNPLDPQTLTPQMNNDKLSWVQYQDNDRLRRLLYEDQVLYLSYSLKNEYSHISYVEQLKESYEKFKMAESSLLYDTFNGSQKKNIDLNSVKWLENNMNRNSKIPEDKLGTGIFFDRPANDRVVIEYARNTDSRYDKFLTKIINIFKNDMFDKLIELNK